MTDGDGVDDRFQKGPGEARGLPRPPDQKAESKFGQFLDEDGLRQGCRRDDGACGYRWRWGRR